MSYLRRREALTLMGTFYIACTPTPGQPGTLSVAGTSITAGYGLSAGQSWGDQLHALLGSTTFFNGGHNGEYSVDMLAHHPSEIAAHFSKIGHAVAIEEIATNDISQAVPMATIISRVESWIALCRTAPTVFPLVGVCTVLPKTSFLGLVDQPTFNAQRALYNAYVRNDTTADFAIDWDADARLLDPTSLTYYQDGGHPTAAGAAIMGGIGNVAVRNALAAL